MKYFDLFISLFTVPEIKVSTGRALRRRFLMSGYNLSSEIFVMAIEPLILMGSLCWGMGFWIPEIAGMSYKEYAWPAAVAFSITFIPYWATSFVVYSKINFGRSYHVALSGPVSASDLAIGDIIWASCKGLISAGIVILFAQFFGFTTGLQLWLSFILLIPACLLFAALGFWAGLLVDRPNRLLFLQGLILGPLCLWSDTLFPFSEFNLFTKWFVYLSPVGQVVTNLRDEQSLGLSAQFFFGIIYLWGLAMLMINLAIVSFQNRMNRDL